MGTSGFCAFDANGGMRVVVPTPAGGAGAFCAHHSHTAVAAVVDRRNERIWTGIFRMPFRISSLEWLFDRERNQIEILVLEKKTGILQKKGNGGVEKKEIRKNTEKKEKTGEKKVVPKKKNRAALH